MNEIYLVVSSSTEGSYQHIDGMFREYENALAFQTEIKKMGFRDQYDNYSEARVDIFVVKTDIDF